LNETVSWVVESSGGRPSKKLMGPAASGTLSTMKSVHWSCVTDVATVHREAGRQASPAAMERGKRRRARGASNASGGPTEDCCSTWLEKSDQNGA
jgi:hypothetical protein